MKNFYIYSHCCSIAAQSGFNTGRSGKVGSFNCNPGELFWSFDILNSLIQHLDLKSTGKDSFQGTNYDIGLTHIFGGLVLAQAVTAVGRTVENRCVHSLHAYFLLPGNINKPVEFIVDRIRDGGSFSTRRVIAIQDQRAIFNMSASFQKFEMGFEHQDSMPNVPGPDRLLNSSELIKKYGIPDSGKIKSNFFTECPVEIRPVEQINYKEPGINPPYRHMWIKADGRISDDRLLHRSILAYASDFGLLETTLLPHGKTFMQPDMHVATLDHCLWFHNDFKADEWMLYCMESPAASGARGFSRGKIYSQEGKIIASVVQEGLIRHKA